MWVYIKSEHRLFTVGFYDPQGHWRTDSDHSDREAAAWRCSFLNGNFSKEVSVRSKEEKHNI